MTRVGYDSVSVADLPAGGEIYLAYVDGRYANYAQVKKRFPHKIVPRITVTGGTLDAEIVDCENGDATPATAAGWAAKKKDRGEIGTIYTSESVWPSVKAACQREGLRLGVDVVFWIAWYTADGSSAIPKGAIGRQYAAPEGIGKSKSKGHYDCSSFADYWPGVDPKPVPKPPKKVGFGPIRRHALRRAIRVMDRHKHPLTVPATQLVNEVIAAGRKVKAVK